MELYPSLADFTQVDVEGKRHVHSGTYKFTFGTQDSARYAYYRCTRDSVRTGVGLHLQRLSLYYSVAADSCVHVCSWYSFGMGYTEHVMTLA